MEKLTPGYYSSDSDTYYFVSSGKGGKVFMTLSFRGANTTKRKRVNIPQLPIRYTIEQARVDLAHLAQYWGFLPVDDVYKHSKKNMEVSA